MRKLKLDLDALQVTSFDTHPAHRRWGTVRGHSGAETCESCEHAHTCWHTCVSCALEATCAPSCEPCPSGEARPCAQTRNGGRDVTLRASCLDTACESACCTPDTNCLDYCTLAAETCVGCGGEGRPRGGGE